MLDTWEGGRESGDPLRHRAAEFDCLGSKVGEKVGGKWVWMSKL